MKIWWVDSFFINVQKGIIKINQKNIVINAKKITQHHWMVQHLKTIVLFYVMIKIVLQEWTKIMPSIFIFKILQITHAIMFFVMGVYKNHLITLLKHLMQVFIIIHQQLFLIFIYFRANTPSNIKISYI